MKLTISTMIALYQPNSKPMCLLYNECVSAVKEYNLKRHFTHKKHGDLGYFVQEGFGCYKIKY